jgi:transposase
MPAPDTSPDDIAALRTALAVEPLARREAEARASGAEAMVAHLKLLIARLKRDKYGASSERRRKLIDQLELELGELVAAASEDAAKAEDAAKDGRGSRPDRPARGQPVRAPLPAHLPRERVVIPGPTACPCCGGKRSKLGEDTTETLEIEPITWKVIQTVRERFSCRACETVTQPPAPFPPIARGRAGPKLLAVDAVRRPSRPSSASTCRSTARARPMPGRASNSASRPSPTGSAPAPPTWRH